jgi:hypothetical protein
MNGEERGHRGVGPRKHIHLAAAAGVQHPKFIGETSVASVASELSDDDIHGVIQSAIDQGAIAEPGANDALVGLNDDCIRNTCPDPNACSLSLNETREQRQTQVTSHEVSEMVTDPKLTAWFDDNGGAENGDICNGEAGPITVGPNTWTVQKMYSKFDDVKTKGGTVCVIAPKKPLPAVQ